MKLKKLLVSEIYRKTGLDQLMDMKLFNVKVGNKCSDVQLPVYCSHPELLYKCTHVNLNSLRGEEFYNIVSKAGADNIKIPGSHDELDEIPLTGITVINPVT